MRGRASFAFRSRHPGEGDRAVATNKNETKHHLDKRASKLAVVPGDDDDLLSTRQLAAWLDCSKSWLEILRHRNQGPRYVKSGPKMVRYPRGEVRAWLKTRLHQGTAEYSSKRSKAS